MLDEFLDIITCYIGFIPIDRRSDLPWNPSLIQYRQSLFCVLSIVGLAISLFVPTEYDCNAIGVTLAVVIISFIVKIFVNQNLDIQYDCGGKGLGVYTANDGTNRHPVTTTSSPLTTEILTYSDQKSLIESSSMNKHRNTMCRRPAMEQSIVPYFRLTSHVHTNTHKHRHRQTHIHIQATGILLSTHRIPLLSIAECRY